MWSRFYCSTKLTVGSAISFDPRPFRNGGRCWRADWLDLSIEKIAEGTEKISLSDGDAEIFWRWPVESEAAYGLRHHLRIFSKSFDHLKNAIINVFM